MATPPAPGAPKPAGRTSEQESLEVAEASREKVWRSKSFLKELFLGSLRLDLVHPVPKTEPRPEFIQFERRMKEFLYRVVDPVKIDEAGEYPTEVIQGLREMGAF